MNLRAIAPLGLAAAVAVGLAATLSAPAEAQSHQTCRMKGIWGSNSSDVFEFDAAYIVNHGEDDFSGVYTNPGVAQANITAAARQGVWNIRLDYVDHAHKGWVRKLIGRGMLDGTTHGIMVTGTFEEFVPGTRGSKLNGTFVIDGKCR